MRKPKCTTLSKEAQDFFSSPAWKEIASRGGKARAKKLTPEQRTQIAQKAVDTREAKRAKKREEAKKNNE